MILLDFISPVHRGPRVWINTVEVTTRCFSLELLPHGQACVHLFAEPKMIDERSVDTGFGMGVIEGELRKQIHTDEYTVLGCPDCFVSEADEEAA